MIASFHLVHYRRQRFHRNQIPHQPGVKYWRTFSTGPDFTALNPGFTRFSLARPEFRRWGFFGIWDDEAALDRFLESSRLARRWEERSAEAWHARLKPIRSAGTWNGLNPLEGCIAPDAPRAPVVVLTRGDVRVSRLPAFWLWATRTAVNDVREAPGFVAGVAMTERPFVEVATLTVWNSLESAASFAFKRQAHKEIIARNREQGIFRAFFAAYFYPYHSTGTWRGRDPVKS
jgi:heme-degrading monooxygenase HmoA